MITGHHDSRNVYIDGKLISPAKSQKVRNHSPDGFSWDFYGGSGPAQLALAILLEFTTEFWARQLYQKFKWEFIAKLPPRDFEMSIEEVKKWIEDNQK